MGGKLCLIVVCFAFGGFALGVGAHAWVRGGAFEEVGWPD